MIFAFRDNAMISKLQACRPKIENPSWIGLATITIYNGFFHFC
ncbi:hypothetical protein NRIC_12610 [Enterococcus florum]|uniref:Uncharacterized protein n=1 Tax=Enterococcus florum TaxID=2480627 RepID=A0A4P5P6J0_9ENTE|nr:hypothetical protein NRIC_12610 [Enterococcus florum]